MSDGSGLRVEDELPLTRPLEEVEHAGQAARALVERVIADPAGPPVVLDEL
ncbi:hypothetical protein [Kribbella antiqua]|uniref:hypothetical protein n=1 Tax=Kribbella antiqua TaxID=2512217 RepID=UPI0013054458|nr:hypothetical protein [Kribbella antiqua]